MQYIYIYMCVCFLYTASSNFLICFCISNTQIIGTRGRTGIVKFLLGSVSDYVVQNVACPVTVVKTPNGWAESHAKVLDLPGMFSE